MSDFSITNRCLNHGRFYLHIGKGTARTKGTTPWSSIVADCRCRRGDVDPGRAEILQRRSMAGAVALGGAADGEGEGRPDPRVLAMNDGWIGR